MKDISNLSFEDLEKYLRDKHLSKDVDSQTAKKVYSVAWENGHAYGNEEVESHYIDISDVVNFAVHNTLALHQ